MRHLEDHARGLYTHYKDSLCWKPLLIEDLKLEGFSWYLGSDHPMTDGYVGSSHLDTWIHGKKHPFSPGLFEKDHFWYVC